MMSQDVSTFKVAVIEDDQPIRELYRIKLELCGFTVQVASNGADGLELLQDFEPHLVLLDLLMPEMDGTTMLQHLRSEEWGANMRVIILTNISKSEAPHVLRFLAVDRYIVKAHSTPAEVVEIAKEVLHLR